MAWTKGQQLLKHRALAPLPHPRGDQHAAFHVDVVLAEFYAGMTRIVNHLQRTTRRGDGPRCIEVCAPSYWDAVLHLSDLARTSGQAHWDRIAHALQALGNGRPLCLLFSESHLLTRDQPEMERAIVTFEAVCRHYHIDCRIMLLCARVTKWNNRQQRRELVWPTIPSRFIGWVRGADGKEFPGRVVPGEIIRFDRTGLDALRQEEAAPLFDQPPATARAAG
jgi:hypothetical protein